MRSIPVVTMMGLQFGCSAVPSWLRRYSTGPALGRLLVDAGKTWIIRVLQAEVARFFASEFILINLLVDILYAVINPRICFK